MLPPKRKEPKEVHIISLGAGVQSSTMALMAAKGEITPMPNYAIFADTGDEPKSVYQWLTWLEKQLPFPVIKVSQGKLTLSEDSLVLHTNKKTGKKYIKINIPAFTLHQKGTSASMHVGFSRRQCTTEFKITPIQKKIKEILKEGGYSKCHQWIGISTDEADRMKPSRNDKIENRWPLIDLMMKRADCLAWMAEHGYPYPPKSACYYCPYHSDAQWRGLKKDEPEEFQKAVEFEKRIQEKLKVCDKWKGTLFLHKSLKPLDQVDFSTDTERGQTELFSNDCSGMCGL